MFAVIKTGGKQYKVAEGDKIVIEKLAADAGENVTFDDVLMLGDDKKVTIGEPLVAGASVVESRLRRSVGAKVPRDSQRFSFWESRWMEACLVYHESWRRHS